MDVLIREARPDGAEGVVRVLNPIIKAGKYTILDTPLTAEAERRFIAEFPERGVFRVAEMPHERRIVGLQTLEPFATYTHACRQRCGPGSLSEAGLPHCRDGLSTRQNQRSLCR